MGTIHFIWLGERLLPEASVERVRAWRTFNPEASLWLWVDKKTRELEAYYTEHLPGVELVELSHLVSKIDAYDLADKEQLRALFQIALYESNRLKPNYGAASDILRYLILYLLIGGEETEWNAYFDHDVATDNQSIASFLAGIAGKETLFFQRRSEQSDASSTDALICTQLHHPILKTVLVYVLDNYRTFGLSFPQARPLVYEHISNIIADDGKEKKDEYATIFRTGPRAFVSSLEKLHKENKLASWRRENFKLDMGEEHYVGFQAPEANAIPLSICPGSVGENTWVPVSVKPVISVKDALNRALHSIQLEVNCFSILRLDDHVKDIVDALAAAVQRLPVSAEGDLEGHHLEAAPSSAGGGAAGGAGAIATDLELDSLALSELMQRYPSIKSTRYAKPTELERAVADRLIQVLETKQLDYSRVKECQFVSRYKNIRDYYDRHIPELMEENEFVLSMAYTMLNLMIKKRTEENAWGPFELQDITDYWLSKIKPGERSYYAARLQKEILSNADVAIPAAADAAGGAGRLSPADVKPFLHAPDQAGAQAAANAQSKEKKKTKAREEDEGGESEGERCKFM